MNLKISKRWDILIWENNPKIWEIEIDNELTTKWYNEMIIRFKEIPDNPTKQWYKSNPLYDIDESYECWQISLPHLRDMFIFLTK